LKIAVFAGGVGGGRFVTALRDATSNDGHEISVIANIGDDMWLSGLKICPDLDSIMYALAGVVDTSRGWGRRNETNRIAGELDAYEVGWPWFTLHDLDLATHIARTGMLHAGSTLSSATRQLASRWPIGVTLIPASDQSVETWVRLTDPNEPEYVHFEEWWVRLRGGGSPVSFHQKGVHFSNPSAGALRAISDAELIILAPSNPVVSIGTMLGFGGTKCSLSGIPGLRNAVRAAPAPVVGVSPIIQGAPVRGMADVCLNVVGTPVRSSEVAKTYGARSEGGLLDGWLVDTGDAQDLDRLSGVSGRAVPLLMSNRETAEALASEAVEFGLTLADR